MERNLARHTLFACSSKAQRTSRSWSDPRGRSQGRGGPAGQYSAVDYGHTNLTVRLIVAEVDVNAMNVCLVTSLHLAVRRGRVNIAKMLLVNGKANQNKKDYTVNMPLHDAIVLDEASLAEEEPQSGAAVIEEQREHFHVALIDLLLLRGADDKWKSDKSGYSPLHQAIRNGYKRTAAVLLAHGVDVCEKSKFGVTPLHMEAAFDANENVWKVFLHMELTRGPDYNER